MPNSPLWPMQDHTAAKHQLLRSFINAWLPIVGFQEMRMNKRDPAVRIIDGFAGPGRYANGEPGSPLILLEALIQHKAFPDLGKARFEFLFVERDRRRHQLLEENLASTDVPDSVAIDCRCDGFENVIDELNRKSHSGFGTPPTFMFVDPFGYSESGISITGNLLQFPRCEVLYFLPLTQISRFLATPATDEALTSLFGSERWREAIAFRGEARNEALGRIFEEQLQGQTGVKYARSLRLYTKDGNHYRLVFGLKHLKGLRAAKDAMWKVDPVAGTSFRAAGSVGQGTLLGSDAFFDDRHLLSALREKFGDRWFSVGEAEVVTLVDTPYRIGHLRQKTLRPAIKNGILIPERQPVKNLKNGVRLRFRE